MRGEQLPQKTLTLALAPKAIIGVLLLFLSLLCTGNHSILSAQSEPATFLIAFSMPTENGAALMLIDPDRPDSLRTVAECLYACEGIAWSADHTRIGYMDDSALIVIDADGTERQRVTIDRGTYPYIVVPAWTADLDRVAYDARYEMRSHLVIVDMVSGTITRLAVGGEKPVWSPDATRLLFTRNRHLIVRTLDGGEEIDLTPDGDSHDRGVWSPDGSQIAFRAGIGATDYALAVMDADGANGRVLIAGIVETPVWSADGTRIATIQWGDLQGRKSSVYAVQVATGEVTLFGRVDGVDFSPVWSPESGWPDSARLAFMGRKSFLQESFNLYMQAPGGERVLLVEGVADLRHPPQRIDW